MATIALKLKPWEAPNFALVEQPPGKRQDGIKELPSIHVSDLSAEALQELASEWVIGLYKKAGKPLDWRLADELPAKEALIEALLNALRAIERHNDNPARFDKHIDELCAAAIAKAEA